MIPFARVAAACAAEGLHALASAPLPEALDPAHQDALERDGVGDMDWILRQRPLRLAPRSLLEGATHYVVVALPYAHDAPTHAGDGLQRARYAAGRDYHDLLRRKLARVGAALVADGLTASRACVDSAPLLERSLAAHAGLGWIGRNGLLLVPGLGSWCFLGELLCAGAVESHAPHDGSDRCGRCHACETACPTAALVDRRVLSTRCISYLTIEHHGVIPRDLAQRFDGWWFGCDRCQEVCPWNRFAPGAGDGRLRGDGAAEARLLAIGPDDFDSAFAGRAVRRLGYERFRRNLLVALTSLGRPLPDELRDDPLPLVQAQRRELLDPL